MKTSFDIIDFGLTDYETIWQRQHQIVSERLDELRGDTLLFGEHPPVITLGRGMHPENLLNPTIPVLPIERGGDVTYHGPGQLIAYPVMKLVKRDLHQYLRDLEEVIIQTLTAYGVVGVRHPGYTGVWVETPSGRRKIASIGVAVKKWVTYHGLALNISTDLAHYHQINPCGLNSESMTRLVDLPTCQPVEMVEVKASMLQAFERVFAQSAETFPHRM